MVAHPHQQEPTISRLRRDAGVPGSLLTGIALAAVVGEGRLEFRWVTLHSWRLGPLPAELHCELY